AIRNTEARRRPSIRPIAVAVIFILTPPLAAGEPALRVAMLADWGVAGNGPRKLEEHLGGRRDVHFVKLRAADIRAGKLAEFDALAVPGGGLRPMAAGLAPAGRDAIKAFVARGGVYVGICAGCYLASAEYPWSLHILPVTVVDKANWERGKADLTIELTAA